MPYDKFDFISNFIDIGKRRLTAKIDPKTKQPIIRNNETVLIHDLNYKFVNFENQLSKLFQKYRRPSEKILAIDECMRQSYSKKDQLQVFMPGKPIKYGQKHFLMADKAKYVYVVMTQLPGQFRNWSNMTEFFQKIVPSTFFNKGYTIVTDNYFHVLDSVLYLMFNGIDTVCTMRSIRLAKSFGANLLKTLVQKQKPANFERLIRRYEASLPSSAQRLSVFFFHDKSTQAHPTVFLSTNADRHNRKNENEVKNISIKLGNAGKPNVKLFYDQSMGYVDSVDRSLTQYSISRAYGSGRPIRRYMDTVYDLCMHNTYVLFYEYWSKKLNDEDMPENFKKAFKGRRFHNFMYAQTAIGLLKDETYIELPTLPNNRQGFKPQTETNFEKRKRCKTSKCKKATKAKCCNCSKTFCENHSARLCQTCYEK